MSVPRILIAGLRGGSGKTLVSLGLVAAWRKQGYRVAPFKKGPDYIDAAWLSMAAGRPCRNLDLFLMSPQAVVRSFVAAAAACRRGRHRGQPRPVRRHGRPGHLQHGRAGQAAASPGGSRRRLHQVDTHGRRARPGLSAARSAGPDSRSHPEPDGRPSARVGACAKPSSRSAACRCWGPSPGSASRSFRNDIWASCRPRNTTN